MTADREIPLHHSSNGQSVYLLDNHELERRGLRQLLESNGIRVSGESGSAREAVRQIPALRPDLVILDDDLPDGSGAGVSSAIAAAVPAIRCLLITSDADETVLIDAILAGAWGCLSKQDGSTEQLRLIRRALGGNTAFSRLFQPALLNRAPGPGLADERSCTLTKPEMNAAIGMGKGLSNSQISHDMSLAEHTVKDLVTSLLTKLSMAGAAASAMPATEQNRSGHPAGGVSRFGRFRGGVADVAAALLICTSEANTLPISDAMRAGDAARLADALTVTRAGWSGPSDGGRQAW
ncbi:response regulator [Pseudarthrobacter sp. NPDC058329]|uniref:response regulator n=1 Tax=Pseudarthrobacter sp. NPDC058329 TaxID=3346448 RepID=UPI0036D88DBB